MSETQNVYVLDRDPHNRIVAHYGQDGEISVGIKMLSESDADRVERGVHAYCVLDVATPLGPLRIRDIRIKHNATAGKFMVHWKQFSTGREREGKPEYLDVAGPQDRDTRDRYRTFILDVFQQIKDGVGLPTSGRRSRPVAAMSTLGGIPALTELRDRLAASETGESEKAEDETIAPAQPA